MITLETFAALFLTFLFFCKEILNSAAAIVCSLLCLSSGGAKSQISHRAAIEAKTKAAEDIDGFIYASLAALNYDSAVGFGVNKRSYWNKEIGHYCLEMH